MEGIVSAILGIVIIVLGILHTKGNLSLLHSYHKERVAEEDKAPFGKLVGLGTIIVGATLVATGGISVVGSLLTIDLSIISTIVLVVGLVVGLGINFYAMIKYNKGIF